jgi:ABC-type transport system involved in multi-copper enzyme maturation permease subunit
MMLVLLLGVLVVTNEYQHQTATATFLTTPHRTRVVIGKLIAAVGLGALFALVTMLINLVAGLIFFSQENLANGLGEWPVTRAMLLNLAGYLLWAVLGVGLGTLVRSQIGSVVLSLVLYLVGYIGSLTAFFMIYSFLLHRDWVLSGAVISPSVASQVMISADPPYPHAPAWWVGALAMVGWGIVSGGVGVLIMRKRDIS